MTSACIVESATEFSFDAAHHFTHFPEGHPNRRLHGHSFRAQITVTGVPDPITGFVCEFSELDQVAAKIRDQLDHQFLNEIEGLGPPSLENLAVWIWRQAKTTLPDLKKVSVFRDSCRQACTYTGAVLDRPMVQSKATNTSIRAGKSDRKMSNVPAE
jgi:6-pyruvoyltetrahydropterin/6-carboxytetrahydropterin synthase